jgi:succinate dehydrogenase / fumarate reductase membrane anchor subunit
MRLRPSLRSPIKRARGLGASGDGTHHFWVQRASAVALIPLTVWFMIEIMTTLLGAERTSVADWLKNPLTALAVCAFIVGAFTHARLGVQTIIEDYVNCEGKKIVTLLILNLAIFGFGAAALMAVVRLHFIGM